MIPDLMSATLGAEAPKTCRKGFWLGTGGKPRSTSDDLNAPAVDSPNIAHDGINEV